LQKESSSPEDILIETAGGTKDRPTEELFSKIPDFFETPQSQ
jgi:hypothetical protein